jgi:hypothetical protein
MRPRIEPELDPGRYPAGVENISFSHGSVEGGAFTKSMMVPADAVVHAEWSRSPRRPPNGLYATTSTDHHEAWCGVRLRLILPRSFDRRSANVCQACLKAFFAEPGAIAPVLIPLDTYGEGFYAIASLV